MPTELTATSVADSTSAGLTDTGLSFIGKAGHLHEFEGRILLTAAATTTGPAVAIDTPATPTAFVATARNANSTTVGTDVEEVDTTVTDAEQMTFTTSVSTQGTIVEFAGFIIPATAGEVKLQFNTEVNGSAITFKGGRLTHIDCGLAV
jgi:hypothetical protein